MTYITFCVPGDPSCKSRNRYDVHHFLRSGDPAVNPDADEICDFIDNDCNGDVDDDAIEDARDGDSPKEDVRPPRP